MNLHRDCKYSSLDLQTFRQDDETGMATKHVISMIQQAHLHPLYMQWPDLNSWIIQRCGWVAIVVHSHMIIVIIIITFSPQLLASPCGCWSQIAPPQTLPLPSAEALAVTVGEGIILMLCVLL